MKTCFSKNKSALFHPAPKPIWLKGGIRGEICSSLGKYDLHLNCILWFVMCMEMRLFRSSICFTQQLCAVWLNCAYAQSDIGSFLEIRIACWRLFALLDTREWAGLFFPLLVKYVLQLLVYCVFVIEKKTTTLCTEWNRVRSYAMFSGNVKMNLADLLEAAAWADYKGLLMKN